MSRSGIDSGRSTSSERKLWIRFNALSSLSPSPDGLPGIKCCESFFVALLFVFLFFYVALARWLTARLPNTLLLFFNWKIPTPLCALPAHSTSNLRFQSFWFIFIFLEFHNFFLLSTTKQSGWKVLNIQVWALLGRFLIEIFKLNEKRLQTLNEIKRDFN